MPNTLRVVSSKTEKFIQCDSGNLVALQDFAGAIKPFVSLRLIGADRSTGKDQDAARLASGQAIITYVISGQAVYADSLGKRGLLTRDSMAWLLSGSGAWSSIEPITGDYLAIELCVALAPALENSPPQSACLDAALIERDGPAALLVGWHGGNRGNFTLPSLMNYALVRLQARQEWCYQIPTNHHFVWIYLVSGCVHTAEGDLVTDKITLLDCSRATTSLWATADSIFVMGSSQEFSHDLLSHKHSIHTSTDALQQGISQLAELELALG